MGRRAHIVRSRAGGAAWEIATRPLPEPLQPFAPRMVGYDESSLGLISQRQLPVPQVVIIVELGPPIRISDPRLHGERFAGGFVAGIGDFVSVTEHDGHQRGIQVDLTPVGARALFGVPMDELAGGVVALPDLLPRSSRSLAEQLEELPTWDARFDVLEQLLACGLARMTERSRLAAWACERLAATAGGLDMRALARELGYSEKHVVRMFRDQVGIAPKLYARLIRFDRLVQRLRRSEAASWGELAAELGYYDQAHLVRDVRHFAGATPTDTRASLNALHPAFR